VPAKSGECPLPDLVVNEGALATNLYLANVTAGECEIAEGCLGGTGQRRVLRFDASMMNKGAEDLVLGNPDAGGPFIYAPCHKHYHFENFARYELRNASGDVVVTGRKQAFCAQDSARVDSDSARIGRYTCDFQGIQVGWQDVYPPQLPCQYIDVTDIPTGTYWLEVEVNPEHTLTELRYDNNRAKVKLDLP
jgi:hypothetical protein